MKPHVQKWVQTNDGGLLGFNTVINPDIDNLPASY
jgi:hypothetical protein